MDTGLLSIIGALYITYLGWESFIGLCITRRRLRKNAKSVQRGAPGQPVESPPVPILADRRVPFLSKTWRQMPGAAVLWVAGFYCALVGIETDVGLL